MIDARSGRARPSGLDAPVKLRIASFNLENLGEKPHHPGAVPPLAERIAVVRPRSVRAPAAGLANICKSKLW